MARYGFVIDTTRCVGCNFCSMTCKVENNIPEGIWWTFARTVGGDFMHTPSGSFPDGLSLSYLSIGCQHCSNPACTKVCPVGATFKDKDTGVVRQEYDRCIGCRMCIAACPYTGIRSYNWEKPKYFLAFATGDRDVPAHQKHTVEKCNMCWHRLARGERPACADVCRVLARYWGDFDDPESEVNKALAGREYKTLLPEKGTKPNVYYLV